MSKVLNIESGVLSPVASQINNFRPTRQVATCVIGRPDGKILLLRGWQGTRCWTLPGGLLDEKETPEQAMLREVEEETGIVLNPKLAKFFAKFYLRNYITNRDLVIHLFMAVVTTCLPRGFDYDIQMSGEHEDYCWIDPVKAQKLKLIVGVKEFIQFYVNTVDSGMCKVISRPRSRSI